ncbi:MAG TPA: YceI family protein [Polyangiaceae bacterium]|nr:YceI family protein [Polyangiaceae bacterium]
MTMTSYDIDPTHTYVGFSIRHMMVTQQRGQFHAVSGKLELNRSDLTKSRVEAAIDVASVDTHVTQRDEHLRGADFFDVANHPQMTFVSKEIRPREDGSLDIVGDLTIRGITRSVTLDVEPISGDSKDPFGMIKAGTSATTKISRKDYGLVWNTALETGGVAVGDTVKITLDLQFQRKP